MMKELFGDIDARLAEARERHRRNRAWTSETLIGPEQIRSRTADDAPARFNLTSLGAWLALTERAGVDRIPAREIRRFPRTTFTRAMDEDEAARAEMQQIEAEIIADLGSDEILRFEQAAPAEVKADRSAGRPLGRGTIVIEETGAEVLPLFEDRFYTTLLDHGAEEIIAYGRPRYEPVMIPGVFRDRPGEWPAEFRVFVENREIVGISNYYPQVDMDSERFAEAAGDALVKARRMLMEMDALHLGVGNAALCGDLDGPSRESRPAWLPNTWGPQHMTLDFFAVSEREAVFLEGGPAGLQAAHPCCFLRDGREIAPEGVSGAVFSDTGPVHPLTRFMPLEAT